MTGDVLVGKFAPKIKYMKYISLMIICLMTFQTHAQTTQTVRGTITDSDSKTPLLGVSVSILNIQPVKGTTTNEKGAFTLSGIPLGRIALKLSYVGYKEVVIPNIVVDAGKEVVLDLTMQELTNRLNEAVVKSTQVKGEAGNEMALVSSRSISIEETKRYAGGFNDPARILSNFAGVTNSGNGNNEVIVRGNSPKYVQWRLEGIEMTNPNHFADQNAIAGGISGLNNNLLATSDFYTGAFAPEYGDALSGVYDLKLRNGNNRKYESIIGIGILGTELTFEGPFSKKYDGSFLANYRYSSLGLITKAGIIDFEVGIPQFQDGAFKLNLPTKKFGHFSIFSLNGWSSIVADDVNPASFPAPGNEQASETVRRDYRKTSYFTNIGLNHAFPLNTHSAINTSLSYATNGIEEKVLEWNRKKVKDANGKLLRDSVWNRREIYNSKLDNGAIRMAVTYNNKIDARNRVQVGTRMAYQFFSYKQQLWEEGSKKTLSDFSEGIAVWRNFISWKHRINERITLVGGLHNTNVLYNNKHTLEPRLSASWNANANNAFTLGYGSHSNVETTHNYFASVLQADSSYSRPNKNLDVLKAHHFVAGYTFRISENLRLKTEVYYQYLYNLPVENNTKSSYATINEGVNFRYVELVNKGTGENYGLELTLERFFARNYYFLINGAVYQSKYRAMDKVMRSTAYDDQFLVNVLGGKELAGLGKSKNQVFGMNGTLFLGGGKTYLPLFRDANGLAGLNPETNSYYDERRAFERRLDPVFRLTVSFSYKWNKAKTTHELFVNLDNITNNTSRIGEFYDEVRTNRVSYQKQVGFFPNVMYRIYL